MEKNLSPLEATENLHSLGVRRLITSMVAIQAAFLLAPTNSFGGFRNLKTSSSSTTISSRSTTLLQRPISISPSFISAPASGTNGNLTIGTFITRTDVNNTNPWITVVPINGKVKKVSYIVSSNGTEVAREGNIYIKSQPVNFTQVAADRPVKFSLSPTNANFGASGGTNSVGLTGTGTWTATSDVSWITNISPSSGSGLATINYRVLSNTNADARVGILSAAGETLTITQNGAGNYLSANTAALSAGGGSKTVFLTASSNSSWTIKTTAKWITNISPPSGTGSASISYSVMPNSNCDSRFTSIVIADGNLEPVLTVNQAAGSGSYLLSTSSMAFPPSGGSDSMYLTTGSSCSWRTDTAANWITSLSPTNGTGSDYITFSVTANPSCQARSASIRILDANSVERGIVILTQAGGPASYVLGSTYFMFPASGANGFPVSLEANCSWTA
ncbi:MAG: BACON domain-containing carbohydrate-binding protein, partial [Verrucomicrobiota bacterium]